MLIFSSTILVGWNIWYGNFVIWCIQLGLMGLVFVASILLGSTIRLYCFCCCRTFDEEHIGVVNPVYSAPPPPPDVGTLPGFNYCTVSDDNEILGVSPVVYIEPEPAPVGPSPLLFLWAASRPAQPWRHRHYHHRHHHHHGHHHRHHRR